LAVRQGCQPGAPAVTQRQYRSDNAGVRIGYVELATRVLNGSRNVQIKLPVQERGLLEAVLRASKVRIEPVSSRGDTGSVRRRVIPDLRQNRPRLGVDQRDERSSRLIRIGDQDASAARISKRELIRTRYSAVVDVGEHHAGGRIEGFDTAVPHATNQSVTYPDIAIVVCNDAVRAASIG